MRKTIALSLVATAVVALGGVAYAQVAPEAAPRGELTRAVVEQRTAQVFGRMDANDDGVLNQADREARQKAMFDRVDADHNGAISPAEFSAMREDRREDRLEARGERLEQRGGPGGPGMGLRGMRGPGAARAADADRDGAVSQAEFTGAALARFDHADADKDGKISRAERRAFRGPMGPMRGRPGGPPPAPDAG